MPKPAPACFTQTTKMIENVIGVARIALRYTQACSSLIHSFTQTTKYGTGRMDSPVAPLSLFRLDSCRPRVRQRSHASLLLLPAEIALRHAQVCSSLISRASAAGVARIALRQAMKISTGVARILVAYASLAHSSHESAAGNALGGHWVV